MNGFLGVIYRYLESLCHNLRSHTITNVQSNNDKVCSWLHVVKRGLHLAVTPDCAILKLGHVQHCTLGP